eukprot:TRINITY_DN3917_c1_g1_i2.p1 TRINITY_DN3917_c1_g1~~TRINITY_DN3917_c1_g1_i2.p1  ORF type:complete len:730 (-),score=266.72 TRINITY_DN3917_c1_g1_i2:193-2382(-)
MAMQIKVRLPGATTPEVVVVNPGLTAKEGIQVISTKLKLGQSINDSTLVIAPTNKKCGAIVPAQTCFKNISFNPKTDVLELWNMPKLINIGLFFKEGGRFILRDKKLIPVDFSASLNKMIPTLQVSLDFAVDSEFSVKYCTAAAEANNQFQTAVWLNVNDSLEEQDVQTDGILLCYPIQKLYKVPEQTISPDHKGWLFKRSIKKDRTTNKQRRLFVLTNGFLYYFKKERDSGAAGVIPLEYYIVARKEKTRGKKFSLLLNLTSDCPFNLTECYKLQCDSENSIETWREKIKKQCVNSGNKKIFGVDLNEILQRKLEKAKYVPNIVLGTTNFLIKIPNGLDVEGIFRISASSSVVEYHRNIYDKGENITFDDINDPHIPANLLKLYFRELPEPLLTFDLYDKFVIMGNTVTENQYPEKIAELFIELPPANYITAKVLFKFLYKVAQHSEENKMGYANLATVFGPNLLRARLDTGISQVQDFQIINTICKVCIQYIDVIVGIVEQESDTLRASTEEFSQILETLGLNVGGISNNNNNNNNNNPGMNTEMLSQLKVQMRKLSNPTPNNNNVPKVPNRNRNMQRKSRGLGKGNSVGGGMMQNNTRSPNAGRARGGGGGGLKKANTSVGFSDRKNTGPSVPVENRKISNNNVNNRNNNNLENDENDNNNNNNNSNNNGGGGGWAIGKKNQQRRSQTTVTIESLQIELQKERQAREKLEKKLDDVLKRLEALENN